VIPPFKRKDTSYTLLFEQHVLHALIGSTEESVARRLGSSADLEERLAALEEQLGSMAA
jgi:hypothetical protein